MSDRSVAEVRHAYEVWVPGCTVNGVPRAPKPTWDEEFSVFMQGYNFGRMSDEDFAAVVKRLESERELARENAGPTALQQIAAASTPTASGRLEASVDAMLAKHLPPAADTDRSDDA